VTVRPGAPPLALAGRRAPVYDARLHRKRSLQHESRPSTTVVGGNTLISRVLGFVRDVVVARLFGAGAGMDVFVVAFQIPNFLRRLFAEGAFSGLRPGAVGVPAQRGTMSSRRTRMRRRHARRPAAGDGARRPAAPPVHPAVRARVS
jgi:hypothetical protein